MHLLSANFLLFSVIFYFFYNIHRYFLVKFSYCNVPLLHHARICSTFARCNYYRELSLESVSTFSQLQKVSLPLQHAIVIVTFIRDFAHSQGVFSWSSTIVGDTSARLSFLSSRDLPSQNLNTLIISYFYFLHLF